MTEGSELAISQDVLFGIAQLALDQVDGVRPASPVARVGEVLSGRRLKGIRIAREGQQVTVDLTVSVVYGVRIPEVAVKAQVAVREAITSMTGLQVDTVNVKVEAIELPEGLGRG
ncbi:MAG: Asp23/Gls24 family envelope stress response protein [Trueperaceae bacterium]|nr:MAG: Asp23/Gls24 family envelope stress response protein [Trueperaceae bacterium]